MLAFAMVFTFIAPAFAATDNYAVSVPKVQDDDDQALGKLVIREDHESDGNFAAGQRITINLPTGVTYVKDPIEASVAEAVYYVNSTDSGLTWEIIAAADNYLTVEASGDRGDGTDGEARVEFLFDVPGYSKVDIDGVTGDIKIEIDAHGTPITSEFITVARVVGGETTTTISSVESIGLDSTGKIGTIRIQENAAGVLKQNNDYIELILPNKFKWQDSSIDVRDAGVSATKVSDSDDRKLKIQVDGESSGQPGFITITGNIIVEDDAREGEVEVTVKGNEVTEEDIVVAKIGDFGFTVETKGDIETIIAGKTDQEVADIIIEQNVPNSWIDGRTVYLELPSWAEWVRTPTSDGPLTRDTAAEDMDEEVKYSVTNVNRDKAELKNLEVRVDADAPAGDLTVKIRGSAGVEGELVIAKVAPPFTVTAEKPEIVIGVQDQYVGDIIIAETEDGAVEDDKWVVIKAPAGFIFNETPDVEVIRGDMEIDNEDADGRFFAFQVDAESAKEASEIKISNIKFNVDRTVPVGDIKFEVNISSSDYDDEVNADENALRDRFRNVISDTDYYEKVMDVVVGTVVTPAPDAVAKSAVFTIGSAIYNVNGVMKVMDAAPYVKEGRTYTPVRYVAEVCGVEEIEYDETTRTVTLVKGDTTVAMVIGSNTITVNGAAAQMDVAPEISNDRTMLPARFVAEAFGFNVGYDNATKAVVISN